jgi:uracil-DNA glycosylase family 4
MTTLEPSVFVQRVKENTSTRALGWILEQHCDLFWDGQELLVIFRGTHQLSHDLLFEDDTQQTLEQIVQNLQPGPSTVRVLDGIPEHLAVASSTEPMLRQMASGCTACRLQGSRTEVVFGVGDPHAALMLVGEAPGRDEDLQGEPSVGRSGQVLTRLLAGIGLTRQTVYITPIVKCRPPNNRTPEPDEFASCEPYLRRQIELVQPHVIVTLGTYAAQALLRTALPLAQMRGRFHDYQGIQVMPTFHPAFLLRNPERMADTQADFASVQVELACQGEVPSVALPADLEVSEEHHRLVREAQDRITRYALVRPTLQDLAAHYDTMESLAREELDLRTRLHQLRLEGRRLGAHLQRLGLLLQHASAATNDRGEPTHDDHDDLDR